MKVLGKNLFVILIALMLIFGIAFSEGAVFAEDKEIPKEGVVYTLTYPDGTTVTEKGGEPLTYDDVMEAMKEENWKLLLSGQKSGADGKVELPANWKAEGAIKIIETIVPAGYTKGSSSEVVTDLKEQSATFVNPKEKNEPPAPPEDEKVKITYDLNGGKVNGSTDDIVEDYIKGTTIIIRGAPEREGYTFDYWKGSEYHPGDKYTAAEDHTFTAQWIANTDDKEEQTDPDDPDEQTEPDDTEPTSTSKDKKTPGGPKTGDSSRLLLFMTLALASAALIALISRKKKYAAGVMTILLVGTFALSSAFAADGFVINKIDDNDDPVEGAVFDIYGKPDVSWEELPPEMTSVTLTKVWNDDSDRDGIRPTADEFKSMIVLKADGAPADKQAVVTDNGDDTYTATWSGLNKYKDGSEIAYTVEESANTGYTAGAIEGSASQGFTVTNTHAPATTNGITLNVNFRQSSSDLSWIAKIVPVTSPEPAERKINVGGEEIEVYKYTYGDPDKKTYYGDMPSSHSVSHWYDASGNELGPTESALIEALKYNAELVYENVTRDVFGGLFKDDITKTITVSGPNGFSKSYSIKLGENSSYKIPVTDEGEYTITQELVASGDINNDAFTTRNTGYTGIISIKTAVVNVTKEGDSFSCEMDKNNTMIYEHIVYNSSKPYILTPFDGGDNPYAEINGWHQGGGTSAGGDTVTINNYMAGTAEQ